MAKPGFTSPFTPAFPRQRTAINTPRCTMGDSVAPVINIKDTKFDYTSKVNVMWSTIDPEPAKAASIQGDVALNISMRSKTRLATLPATDETPEVCPPGTAPADFYYPKDTRNRAPVVEIGGEEFVSVRYSDVEAVVGGISSNEVESVAFWKRPTYKYSAPQDTTAPEELEIISTAKFEGYYPSNIRNLAPAIVMKSPKGDWDMSAFLQVSTEYVALDLDFAKRLSESATSEGDASSA